MYMCIYTLREGKGWCSEKKQIKLSKEGGRFKGSIPSFFDLSLVMRNPREGKIHVALKNPFLIIVLFVDISAGVIL